MRQSNPPPPRYSTRDNDNVKYQKQMEVGNVCRRPRIQKRRWNNNNYVFRSCVMFVTVVMLVLLPRGGQLTFAQAQDGTETPSPSPTSIEPILEDSISPTIVVTDNTIIVDNTVQPSASPLPTLEPTEPPPTPIPSSGPSISVPPSTNPTISIRPSVSIEPSFNPTSSMAPTETPRPSPGPSSSLVPTWPPSVSPSASPTDPPEILDADTFNNRMIFDGLPFFINWTAVNKDNTTGTGNQTWENITSNHVTRYWRTMNYSQFNITAVQTKVIAQFPEPTDGVTNRTRTRVIYDQRIRYWTIGPDSPVGYNNLSILFTWPFWYNSQPYSDDLWVTFQTTERIQMLTMGLSANTNPPGAPTMSVAPAVAPAALPSANADDEDLETTKIIAIAIGAVAGVGLISVVIIWYLTRRKPEIMLDEEFVVTDDDYDNNDMVMVTPRPEDPQVFVPDEKKQGGSSVIIPQSSSSNVVAARHSSKQSTAARSEQPSEKSFVELHEGQDYIIDQGDNNTDVEKDGSLHVGIPLDEREMGTDDDVDDEDEDSYYYPQQDVLTDSILEANRPSMSGFALKISELEE